MEAPKSMLGEMAGIDDAGLQDIENLPGNAPMSESINGPAGDALWWFINKGTINGIPVEPSDLGAKVDSDELLQTAFILDRHPCSVMFRLSPDNGDELEKYNRLLEDVYAGKAAIIDETKQFCPEKGYFLVWVRYDEIRYVLHPRYEYLKE